MAASRPNPYPFIIRTCWWLMNRIKICVYFVYDPWNSVSHSFELMWFFHSAAAFYWKGRSIPLPAYWKTLASGFYSTYLEWKFSPASSLSIHLLHLNASVRSNSTKSPLNSNGFASFTASMNTFTHLFLDHFFYYIFILFNN